MIIIINDATQNNNKKCPSKSLVFPYLILKMDVY